MPVAAAASEYNQRTELTFSEPVMVPGATLQPGRYTFELADSRATRQVVEIRHADGAIVNTVMAVPIRRENVRGDSVLKFNPTTTSDGAPVALKAWFYPGRTTGHEFVYSDAEARDIARRSRTIVLSMDAGDDDGKGEIYVYDASGRKTRRSEQAQASVKSPPQGAAAESTTAMMSAERKAERVEVGQLEENPGQYAGRTISVDAEVDEVLGPRTFTIDERNWGDLDAEVLVFVPNELAALVRRDDRVTVTGTVRSLGQDEIGRAFSWLDSASDMTAKLSKRPALVASRIVGGDDDVALAIRVRDERQDRGRTSTTGEGARGGVQRAARAGSGRTPLGDLQALATGGTELVGRRVRLDDANVADKTMRGFWVRSTNGESLFVLPSGTEATRAEAGTKLTVSGVVLEMPRGMRDQLKSRDNGNTDVYVYASNVTN
jgi:hypothetical protein